MTRPVTASDIATLEPLLINPAQYTAEHRTLLKQLVVRDPLKEGMGRVKHAPTYGTVNAHAATEGTDVDNPQIYTISDVTFTPSEIVAQVILTDKAVRTSGENQVRAVGRLLGDAMARKTDTDGIAQFDSFTTHALGDGTANIAIAKVTGAVTLLKGNATGGPAPSPLYMVIRPEQMAKLLDALAPTAGTYPIPEGVSEEAINEYLAHDFKLFGLRGGFWSGNITRTSTGTVGDADTLAKGALFCKEALRYVPADEMSMEKERLVRARAWLFQSSSDYAFGIFKQGWGCELNYLAADPT